MSLKSIAEKRASFDDEHGTGKEVTKSDIKNHIKADQKEFTQLKTKAESIENTVEEMKEEDAQTLKDLNKESALILKIAERALEKIALNPAVAAEKIVGSGKVSPFSVPDFTSLLKEHVGATGGEQKSLIRAHNIGEKANAAYQPSALQRAGSAVKSYVGL